MNECIRMNECLSEVARDYSKVKFCKIQASIVGVSASFVSISFLSFSCINNEAQEHMDL